MWEITRAMPLAPPLLNRIIRRQSQPPQMPPQLMRRLSWIPAMPYSHLTDVDAICRQCPLVREKHWSDQESQLRTTERESVAL
mmetsp:Transcript_81754/g.162743  ORF Transcript_81754/g.162743 Transcript_81754/m.162743 type:complete len:83 (-) Transcript_81754:937-1185(-)